jgi:hypothetical protein
MNLMYNPRNTFTSLEGLVVIRRVHIVVVIVVLSLLGCTQASAATRHHSRGKKGTKQASSKQVVRQTRTRTVSTRTVRMIRSRRHVRLRRVVWNPLFKGSHELLVRQNLVIDEMELPRIQDDEELEIRESNSELVPMDDTESLVIASNLIENRRWCKPWTREFLQDLSEAYYQQFRQPLVITSLVRTAEQQKKLRRHNRNAAPDEGDTVSTHLTGMTFDLYKRGMTRKQHKWIEDYFLPLKEAGLIDPIEERRQPVFHVTVFNEYTEWREAKKMANAPRTIPMPIPAIEHGEREIQIGASN